MSDATPPSPLPNSHNIYVQAPVWDTARPYLTGDFLVNPRQSTAPALSTYSSSIQHSLAIHDVISALLGVRPDYAAVTTEGQGNNILTPSYHIHHDRLQRAHTHVAPFLTRILPLATHHACVRTFIESSRLAHETGHVRQALASAMTDLLADYHAFVLRLETAAIASQQAQQQKTRTSEQSLTLQKLLYLVQPTARSMNLLASIAAVASGTKRGGAVFDPVHSLAVTFVGSPDEKAVLAFLVGRAAAPILDALAIWLASGTIDDPYGEFFIAHDSSFRGTALDHRTWEMRFTVNSANVPTLLQPFVERILRAGKYLSVLRDCDVDIRVAVTEAAKTFAPGELPVIPPSASPLDLNIIDEDDSQNPHTSKNDLSFLKRSDFKADRFHLSGATLLGPDASRRISVGVDRAFKLASAALMNFLVRTVKIRDRLRGLKRFFLLEQGDYLVHFLDAASTQLGKQATQVSRSRLKSLLELAVRSSAAGADSFLDDLSIDLMDRHVAAEISALIAMPATPSTESQFGQALSSSVGSQAHNQDQAQTGQLQTPTGRPISGFEAVALTYNLHWPMKLIVSSMDVTKYQLMFRYLFYAKHVERQVINCWSVHSQAKISSRRRAPSLVRSFALRNRMLQFIRSLLYYTVADVIEPNWRALDSHLRCAETIDDIMTHHANFLSVCSLQSLLSNERHQHVFKQLCETCLTFAAYTRRFDDAFASRAGRSEVEEQLRARNYPATLTKFETSFDMHFGNLLDGVSALSKTRANIHLANLCERLDAGAYYTGLKERSLASLGC